MSTEGKEEKSVFFGDLEQTFESLNELNLVSKAIILATFWHNKQKRKDGKTPYISHPLAVATISRFYDYHPDGMTPEEVYAAACLHDVLEDCAVSVERLRDYFPKVVVDTVVELTNDRDRIKKSGKVRYLQEKMANMSDGAFFIKLCDRLHNISENPTDEYLVATVNIINYIWVNRDIRRPLIPLMSKILDTAGKKLKYVNYPPIM